MDDNTYRDLVRLGRERCREAALSVVQLLDDRDQRVALLVNIAIELAAGAVDYMRQGDDKVSEEGALKAVISGICHGLDVEKYLSKPVAKKSR
jgi:hypothetical protein